MISELTCIFDLKHLRFNYIQDVNLRLINCSTFKCCVFFTNRMFPHKSRCAKIKVPRILFAQSVATFSTVPQKNFLHAVAKKKPHVKVTSKTDPLFDRQTVDVSVCMARPWGPVTDKNAATKVEGRCLCRLRPQSARSAAQSILHCGATSVQPTWPICQCNACFN